LAVLFGYFSVVPVALSILVAVLLIPTLSLPSLYRTLDVVLLEELLFVLRPVSLLST
jgi:hypothetical protein